MAGTRLRCERAMCGCAAGFVVYGVRTLSSPLLVKRHEDATDESREGGSPDDPAWNPLPSAGCATGSTSPKRPYTGQVSTPLSGFNGCDRCLLNDRRQEPREAEDESHGDAPGQPSAEPRTTSVTTPRYRATVAYPCTVGLGSRESRTEQWVTRTRGPNAGSSNEHLLSRLRYWLHLPQAPKYGTGFIASEERSCPSSKAVYAAARSVRVGLFMGRCRGRPLGGAQRLRRADRRCDCEPFRDGRHHRGYTRGHEGVHAASN